MTAWGLSFRAPEADDRSLAITLAAGAAAAATLLPFAPWVAFFAPRCLFHALTGLPCPACGTTRAVLALGRGDLFGALSWNPLATAALLAGGAACLFAPAWIALRGPVPTLAPSLPLRARIVLVAAVAANWAWLVARGV